MDVWLKVVRIKGNTYRPGDVVCAYELAPTETPPDLSHLVNPRGAVKYCSVGVRNLPAHFEELDQALRFFRDPWEDEPTDPEGERESPPDNAERDRDGNITRAAFMPRRRFVIQPAQFPTLFDDPPYTLTLDWSQLRSGMRQHKEDRPVTDNDIPQKRSQSQPLGLLNDRLPIR